MALYDFLSKEFQKASRSVGGFVNNAVQQGRAGAQSARMPSQQQNIQRNVIRPAQNFTRNVGNAVNIATAPINPINAGLAVDRMFNRGRINKGVTNTALDFSIRGPAQTAARTVNLLAPKLITTDYLRTKPTTNLEKTVYGEDAVGTFGDVQKGVTKTLQSGGVPKKFAEPLGVAGVVAGGLIDVVPGGESSGAKLISKASNARMALAAAKKLGLSTDPKTIQKIINTVDPKQAQKIIDSAKGAVSIAKKSVGKVDVPKDNGITAFHGSPYDDLKDISFGTGVRSKTFMGGSYETKSPSIFFTEDPKVAKEFAQNRVEYLTDLGKKTGKGTVYERKLNIKNPLDTTDIGKVDDVLQKLGISAESKLNGTVPEYGLGFSVQDMIDNGSIEKSDLWKLFDDPEVVSKLKSAGYDGAKVLETGNRGTSWAVFDPKSISQPTIGANKNVANRNTVELTGQKSLSQAVPTNKAQVPLKTVPPKQIAQDVGQQNVKNAPPSITNIPQNDPVKKIISALTEAKPIRSQTEKLYSAERSKRVAQVIQAGKVGGEKGYFTQLSKLKGELPKVQFESIRNQIKQPDIDSLFDTVEKANMLPFEKINAKAGLSKLLGAEGGAVPNRTELRLLGEIFPKDFVQAVLGKRSTMEKLWSGVENALNLPRAIMATADLSAPLRQGVLLIGRPKQFLPAFRDMFKYAASEKAYQGFADSVKLRPTYLKMRQGGLQLTDMGTTLNKREEAFMTDLAEKIPVFGKLAKGSNRAYSGFLNKLRADTFDDIYKKAVDLGVADDKTVRDIARFVNTATGRGGLGKLEDTAAVLNGVFFSPRLMSSRLNTLNPLYYTSLSPVVRKEAVKSLLTFGAVAGSILGLAKAGGANVSVDPRSADFGKIKVGDTRYDPWGGFQQYIVLASRLATGEMVSSTTGKEFKLGTGYKPTTRYDIIQRFLESKEAPIASFVTALVKGQTAMGEAVNIPAEVIDRFIPMLAQDVYDLTKEYGTSGLFMAMPGAFGVGSQTYTDQIPVKAKTPSGRETIKWRSAPGIGEAIVNKVTGTKITDIPENEQKILRDERLKETLRKIDIDKLKTKVLETGKTETYGDTIIYLDNGVVKTKKVTQKKATKPKTTKLKTAKKKKSTKSAKAKAISIGKAKKVSLATKAPTVKSKGIKIAGIAKGTARGGTSGVKKGIRTIKNRELYG